eukprot:TRINITY_DN2340_c0_g3_i3.p3 TRINITY_DN2340_c0_g3~~TRINITY_DN2340_c0_g3_i3.p3  ORF type:complete len:185 (-),score=19.47 TRINITY_DN2340_c0_g3_i3:899-1453(-)
MCCFVDCFDRLLSPRTLYQRRVRGERRRSKQSTKQHIHTPLHIHTRESNQLRENMGPRMKMFGVMKYLPRPKTTEEWSILYYKNKIILPQANALTKLTLNYSTYGPGNAGIRHFKAYTIPPLLHWNPNVEVQTNLKKNEKNFTPTVTLHFQGGETKDVPVSNLHSKDILSKVVSELSSSPSSSS